METEEESGPFAEERHLSAEAADKEISPEMKKVLEEMWREDPSGLSRTRWREHVKKEVLGVNDDTKAWVSLLNGDESYHRTRESLKDRFGRNYVENWLLRFREHLLRLAGVWRVFKVMPLEKREKLLKYFDSALILSYLQSQFIERSRRTARYKRLERAFAEARSLASAMAEPLMKGSISLSELAERRLLSVLGPPEHINSLEPCERDREAHGTQ